MHRVLVGCWLVLAIGLFGGCTKSGSGMREVEGTVAVNGVSLAEGDITFTPEDKQFGPESGKVKDGKFKFRARDGKAKVTIAAVREVPGKQGPMGEPLIEDVIPVDHFDKHPEIVEVGSGKTKFEFKVTLPK